MDVSDKFSEHADGVQRRNPNKPVVVVEGRPSARLRRGMVELWAFRGTMLAFAQRDIRVKYKQAVLGIGWAIIQPIVFVGIFTFALGRAAHVSGGGVPYGAFALSTLVPWTALQGGVVNGTSALLADASIVRKIYFPREVPVVGSVLAAAPDLVVGLALALAVGPFVGAHPSPAWLLVPFLAALTLLLALAVSLLLAGLNVYYRDLRHALPFALQAWLFASPVVYPLTSMSPRSRAVIITINPAAGLMDSWRRVLALGQPPSGGAALAAVVSTAVLLIVGYRLFKTLEPNFADVI
jgi:ABC-type polysaccharide/polyol phosphate export permease